VKSDETCKYVSLDRVQIITETSCWIDRTTNMLSWHSKVNNAYKSRLFSIKLLIHVWYTRVRNSRTRHKSRGYFDIFLVCFCFLMGVTTVSPASRRRVIRFVRDVLTIAPGFPLCLARRNSANVLFRSPRVHRFWMYVYVYIYFFYRFVPVKYARAPCTFVPYTAERARA